jgi:hypothetical protein
MIEPPLRLVEEAQRRRLPRVLILSPERSFASGYIRRALPHSSLVPPAATLVTLSLRHYPAITVPESIAPAPEART